MDVRAQQLIDEMGNLPQGEPLDFTYWRERYQTLFSERLDDETRQTLLAAYAAMLDLVDRSLIAQGRDAQPFRDARAADWNTLCIQEALQRSGTDLFHPDDLNEIVQREVGCGRMEEGKFSQFAADGAAVLGAGKQESEPKKGLFKRIFG